MPIWKPTPMSSFFIIAGPEFEELEGFILIFNKALYGLKCSGKRWAEKFYDVSLQYKI